MMSFDAMSWAVKQKIPALQKIVLLMLADRTNKDTGRCDPSITRLADDCGMSERSTRNAIRELEKLELIETVRRSNEGVNLPNHYRLKIQNLEGVGHDMPQGTAGDAPGVGHHVPTNQEVKPVIKPITVDGAKNASSSLHCPHQKIIDLYHEILPMGAKIKIWNGAREKHLQTRWRESSRHQSIDFWKRLFEYCAQSPFLTSKVPPSPGRKQFVIALDWIIKPENFAKIIEERYHKDIAA